MQTKAAATLILSISVFENNHHNSFKVKFTFHNPLQLISFLSIAEIAGRAGYDSQLTTTNLSHQRILPCYCPYN